MEKFKIDNKKKGEAREEGLNFEGNSEEEKYKKEILSIIEIIKPDDLPLDEYEQEVLKDLFESVKEQQIARGILIQDPEKTIKEMKDLLNSRLKSVLLDDRDYNKKTKPDQNLVKKAKIALLFEGDTSDVSRTSYYEKGMDGIDNLRNYIVGYGDKNKFTESDINLLMKTKYKKSLTSVRNSSYLYIGNYGTMDKIPKSLMIGLVQAEEEDPKSNHFYTIKDGLKTAEIAEYDNDCLEQLLASDYTSLCFEHVDKFKGESIEKILKSGDNYSDGTHISYLKQLDLSEEDFVKYLDIIIKHNICYDLRSSFGRFYNKEREVVSVHQDSIKKLHDIEMDVHYENDIQNILNIKDVIENGGIGLALATPICREYIKKYTKDNYEDFLKAVNKYDQEHLVFEYLKDDDKISYAEKLIEQGEEYQLVKLHKLFKEHSLSLEIFTKIKNKNLIYSLKGDLLQFKELPSEEAIELIDRERTKIFIDNISSFNLSEEFLKSEKVQEACFSEFNKAIMSFDPYKARVISEKIPFDKEKLDQAVLKTIKYKWSKDDGGGNNWARAIIYQFPEIKKYLNNKEDQERAFNDLKEELNSGCAVYVAEILECFPLDEELLKSEEIKTLCLKSIEESIPRDEYSKGVERYFKNIDRISKYIEVPEYLLQQRQIVNSIYAEQDKALGLIEGEFITKILNSKTPLEKYNDILKLLDEVKDSSEINTNKSLLLAYITEFENKENKEEKQKFISYINKIAQDVPKNIIVDNWDYLYKNFSALSGPELESHKILLKSSSRALESDLMRSGVDFLENIEFQNIFDRLNSYSPQQQNEMLEIMEMDSRKSFDVFDENNYTENTIAYINDVEDLNVLTYNKERKNKVLEMFGGEYKDVSLKMLSKEWRSFLNTDSKFLPPNIYFISKFIDEAGGAGNLKHLESLGNLIHQVNSILENPKTAERTKREIKNLLFEQELKFDKEKLSQDDRSEFYNLSNDILKASPSLYSAFSPIFESMSPKNLKIFIKDIFPFYQAQLTIIQEIGEYHEIEYKPRELVYVRESLKNIKKRMEDPSEDIKNIFASEKDRLVEVVKNGFKNRFGLMKIPSEFKQENLRSIQNGIRYINNINERSTQKETIIAFYIGLEINNEWDDFRQGKEIKLEEYFSGKQLDIIKSLVESKNKGYELLSEIVGITKKQMPKFQEILQSDTISNIIGNIKTVDVKLGDIKRNILELMDPDIYEKQTDKNMVALLSEKGKLIGAVLAKTYNEISGKKISFDDEERELQSKIASIFDIKVWSVDKVKQIQDSIQPLSLIANMANKMNEEKVDENIQELTKRLMPSIRIIEIFNRLGEEFKQESGAMALSKDLTYLESLVIKDDKKITPEEKEEIGVYIDSIKNKMKDLEITLDKIREYFNKLKNTSHLENNVLLKNRLADIEKIIYSEDSSAMIVSHMTKDLNLIIENMRQCLGCMRKEINNDTNLAFGDYNKFFMMNQGGKEKGSISDEIVFFVPIKTPNGREEMSFVLDRVYGSKSSDILISNILSVYKKYQAIKKEFPKANISITITNEAMLSVGLNSEIIKKRLSQVLKNITNMDEFTEMSVNIPPSAFGDNYVEFGSGRARESGERQFSGLILTS